MVASRSTPPPGGQPNFIVSGSNPRTPPIKVDPAARLLREPPPNSPEFVVANSAQGSIDAQGANATNLFTTTARGVQLSDIGRPLAFAVRFRDINLLISATSRTTRA